MKYKQNKQLFRYLNGGSAELPAPNSTTKYEVANAEEVKKVMFVSCWDSI